jgi:hypothetical protein
MAANRLVCLSLDEAANEEESQSDEAPAVSVDGKSRSVMGGRSLLVFRYLSDSDQLVDLKKGTLSSRFNLVVANNVPLYSFCQTY